jgi:superfamily II DNA or RNA helicase
LQARRSALDASDTGTGKTVVALFICKALDVVPFVVGPKSARAGWERLAAQVGLSVEYVNYEKLRGRRSARPDGIHVAQTNWIEEKPWGKGSFLKWKNNYECIIFDEVHRCGGSTSLNSKLLIAAKRQARYVLALSATAADDPRQMKALGYALDLHGLSKKVVGRVPWGRPDFISWLLRHGCSPGVFGGFDFAKEEGRQKVAFTKLHHEVFPEHGGRMRKAEIPGFPKTQIDIKLLTDDTGKAAGLTEELHAANADGASLTDTMTLRLKLEKLMVPDLLDLVDDYAAASKVVIFVSFTEPLEDLYDILRKKFGVDQVGYISGRQVGKGGEAQRNHFLDLFQANKLTALVCNVQAGGESCNMHDATGQVERTTLITPCESGRQYKQVLGRVNRDGGAFSLQLLTYFANTYQEVVADRLAQKGFNLDLLNDGDFLC